jgi:hypothetical protein
VIAEVVAADELRLRQLARTKKTRLGALGTEPTCCASQLRDGGSVGR